MSTTKKRILMGLLLLTLVGVSWVAAQSPLPGSGWTTGQQFQNVGDSPADITMTAYNQSGVSFDCGSQTAGPGGAANFQTPIHCPVPPGFVGSGVVSSNQSLVGIVNVNNAGTGTAAGHYRATDSLAASTSLSFPLLKHNYYGRTTTFSIQNTSDTPTNITYTIAMQNGETVTERISNIPAYAMAMITPADAGIPPGNDQVGSLTVTGDQPLAGVSLEHQHSAAVAQNLQASQAFSPAAYDSTVYCPLYRNAHTGKRLTTGAQVQNVSSQPQTVTMTYTPVGGGPMQTSSATIDPGESATFYAPDRGIPANSYGAVTIVGEKDIVAVVNDEGMDNGLQRTTTYACFPAHSASNRVNLPLAKEFFYGETSGIQVQNVGSAPAKIELTYFPWGGGDPVVIRNVSPTPPGAAFTAWGISLDPPPTPFDLISGDPTTLFGRNTSVVVESDQPILAIVNESSEGSQPSGVDNKTYEGFNQLGVTFAQDKRTSAIFKHVEAVVTQMIEQSLPFIMGAPEPWAHVREAETVDEFTVGQLITRSSACNRFVHGQFGTIGGPPWSAQAGHVKYTQIEVPRAMPLLLRLRYSKSSPSSVPIDVYLDDETTPRASFTPDNQGNWNSFAWTPPIGLGSVSAGLHSLTLRTMGQQFGVVDLDVLQLISNQQLPIYTC